MWKAFIQSAPSESQGSVASNTEAPTLKCEGLHPPQGPARHQRPISTWGCIRHSLLASTQVMKQDLASCSKFSQFSYLNTTRSSGRRGQTVPGSRHSEKTTAQKWGSSVYAGAHKILSLLLHVSGKHPASVKSRPLHARASLEQWLHRSGRPWLHVWLMLLYISPLDSVPLRRWGEPPLPMEPETRCWRPLYLRFLTGKHKWLRLKWFQIPWDKIL